MTCHLAGASVTSQPCVTVGSVQSCSGGAALAFSSAWHRLLRGTKPCSSFPRVDSGTPGSPCPWQDWLSTQTVSSRGAAGARGRLNSAAVSWVNDVPGDASRTLFTEDTEQAITLQEQVINLVTSQRSHPCSSQQERHGACSRGTGMDFAVLKAEGKTLANQTLGFARSFQEQTLGRLSMGCPHSGGASARPAGWSAPGGMDRLPGKDSVPQGLSSSAHSRLHCLHWCLCSWEVCRLWLPQCLPTPSDPGALCIHELSANPSSV